MKIVFVFLLTSFLTAALSPAAPPNVVYILADDLGWSDVSVHPGGAVKTPNIDKLFGQGMELRNFMGWCLCSPTRAMLLTGRHPFRVGTGPATGGELSTAETTIAEGFKAHGYRTGIFGKWHNGGDPDTPESRAVFAEAFKNKPNRSFKGGHGVNEHGFDEAWVYYGGGEDYFTRRTSGGKGPVSWWHNREFRPKDIGYTEDLIIANALNFIRANKAKPFFCYLPLHLVHSPWQSKEEDMAAIDPSVTDPMKRTYAAMIRALDNNIARVLGELDQLGLRDNTIVVFTSDNGGTKNGSNLPFAGGKGTLQEGGTHLATVIHWPNGKMVGGHWEGLCTALDMFPTLMAMAELEMPGTRPLDGKNLWPALRDQGESPVESCYWSMHNSDAIRTAQWRMHRFFNRIKLYDIRNDPGETKDVASDHPEVVEALKAKMNTWVSSLDAALTHQTPKKKADPSPEGQVLEIAVTVIGNPKPKDMLIVPFARKDGHMVATDHIEFDIAAAKDSPLKGAFYTPFDGNNAEQAKIAFSGGEGIDQFGREQISAPAPQGGAGVWERRIVGLSSYSPGGPFGHAIAFRGVKPGTYKVYLDNLQIRHADGKTTPIWLDQEDTRKPKAAETEFFKNIQVRTVSTSEVGK